MMGFGEVSGLGFGMGLFGGIMMLLFWAAIILLVVWAVRSVFPSQRQSEHESAVEILKRRYAAGEISQAEYEQARKALGNAERTGEDAVSGGRK
jgi:putative membrane protein